MIYLLGLLGQSGVTVGFNFVLEFTCAMNRIGAFITVLSVTWGITKLAMKSKWLCISTYTYVKSAEKTDSRLLQYEYISICIAFF